jgi:type III secretion protein T
MGSLMDPTSGQESTEIQNFINFCICVMYLEFGGLNIILNTLVQSFQHIGLTQNFEVHLDSIAPFLGQIFAHGFVLAAPILITLLITEALLGLLSRFTPQLSAFSVAMTIKSVIAIFILSLYFWQVAPDRLQSMTHEYASWSFLKGVN